MVLPVKTLEEFVRFAAYCKAYEKGLKREFESSLREGYLQEEEEALVASLIIGIDKLDNEYRQLLAHCCERLPDTVVKIIGSGKDGSSNSA